MRVAHEVGSGGSVRGGRSTGGGAGDGGGGGGGRELVVVCVQLHCLALELPQERLRDERRALLKRKERESVFHIRALCCRCRRLIEHR